MSVRRGVPSPGGAWSQEGSGLGGGLLREGGSGPGGVPGGDPPMATAAGGTHPTGMHSCIMFIFSES